MPDSPDLATILQPFKNEEETFIHTTIMLVGDRDSQKILSTWSMMPIRWIIPKTVMPEDSRFLWDWVWTGVVISWRDLEARSGIAAARVQKMFEPLKANRLLYPDGTLPNHVSQFLRAEIKKALPKTPKSKEKD
jgi:hypothetical protein